MFVMVLLPLFGRYDQRRGAMFCAHHCGPQNIIIVPQGGPGLRRDDSSLTIIGELSSPRKWGPPCGNAMPLAGTYMAVPRCNISAQIAVPQRIIAHPPKPSLEREGQKLLW